MPFASIEFRFSIHPRMHVQLTKTPNIRSLFPMYALKHAYPLEWHLRESWNMAPAVASHSRTGNRAYPNRKATDSPAMIGSLILDGETGLNGILRSHGCQIVSWGVFIHP